MGGVEGVDIIYNSDLWGMDWLPVSLFADHKTEVIQLEPFMLLQIVYPV